MEVCAFASHSSFCSCSLRASLTASRLSSYVASPMDVDATLALADLRQSHLERTVQLLAQNVERRLHGLAIAMEDEGSVPPLAPPPPPPHRTSVEAPRVDDGGCARYDPGLHCGCNRE